MNTQVSQDSKAMSTFKALSKQPIFYPLIGFLLVFIIMTVVSDSFLTYNNLSNIGRQVSINAIIAVGMTFAILTGGIDLAVGSVMALSGTIMAGLMAGGMPMTVAIVAGIALGCVLGGLNGMMVAYAKMPPFIVTLAMMTIARGLALIYTGGYPIAGIDQAFAFFGRGSVLGIVSPIIIAVIVYAIAYIVLNHTPFGRHVYATGGNYEASRVSFFFNDTAPTEIYTISGLTSALAGLIITSRLMSGQPNAGVAFELDAIAAVVLGGAAMNGGKGTILGTLMGALLLGVLNNGLNLIGINPYVQNVIKGIIILFAIYVGTEKKKARS